MGRPKHLLVQTHPGAPPAGWYPDPWQVATHRYWDGAVWTHHTHGHQAVYPPPPEPPRARDDISGGWTAILGWFGSIAIGLLFARAAIAAGASESSLLTLVVAQAGLWGGMTMTAYIVTHRRPGGSLTDLGLRVPIGKEAGIGIGMGVAGLFAAARIGSILQSLFPDNTTNVSHLFTEGRPTFTVILVTGLLACVGAPFFEEIFFRGIVQPVLTHHLGVPLAIIVQALLFGAAHFQIGMTMNEAIVRCGTVAVIGCVLGWLRARTGRLGAGMCAHATNNVIVVALTAVALGR